MFLNGSFLKVNIFLEVKGFSLTSYLDFDELIIKTRGGQETSNEQLSPQDQHLELESRFPHLPDATAACSNLAGAAHHVTKGQAIKRMGTFTHSAGECALTGECAERALNNRKCKTKGSGDELCSPLLSPTELQQLSPPPGLWMSHGLPSFPGLLPPHQTKRQSRVKHVGFPHTTKQQLF